MRQEGIPTPPENPAEGKNLLRRQLQRSEVAREEAEKILSRKSKELAKAVQQSRLNAEEIATQLKLQSQFLTKAQNIGRVATYSVEDGVVHGSDNLEEILGSNNAITHVRQMLAIVHPLDKAGIAELMRNTATGTLVNLENEQTFRVLDHKGQKRWLKLVLSQEHTEAKQLVTFGALLEVTAAIEAERRQKALRLLADRRLQKSEKLKAELRFKGEELTAKVAELKQSRANAKAADQAKSRFLAMMSHDLRTPLNALLGILELLGTTKLTTEQRKWVYTASQSGDQLLQFLADILEYGRFEGWEIDIDPAPVCIADFITDTVNGWYLLAKKAGLTIKQDMADNLPDFAVFDRKRVRQILDNYISNATKYSNKGSITIEAIAEQSNNGPAMKFCVVDEGEGFAAGQTEQLFDELQRGTQKGISDIEGKGLGLPICRHIAKALDGEVGAHSKPGQGSQFWVSIPLILPRNDRSAINEKAIPTKPSKPLHILVAEDIEANRIVMGSMLETLDCTAEFAENGMAAVTMAKSGAFNCILMDISMPVMDGIEASRLIRRAESLAGIPIVGVTAYAADDERKAILAAGVNEVITKPVNLVTLSAILSKIASHKLTNDSNLQTIPVTFEQSEIIDKSRLESQMTAIPENRREQLFVALKRDLASWFDKFCKAATARNQDDLAKAHHALKGICAAFGLHALEKTLIACRQHDDAKKIDGALLSARAIFDETMEKISDLKPD